MSPTDDSNFTKDVRVRFAPSPTGWMHIGSIRQIIYNYLWARACGGVFVLRIEDTDVKRTVDGGIDSIYELMEAFGVESDEGPLQGGDYGPYVQSERLDLYTRYAEELVQKGAAYYCFCSKERVDKLREEQIANNVQPKYDRRCRGLSKLEVQKRIAAGEKYVIRLAVPQTGVTEYDDVLHGRIPFKNRVIDDQILLKSDRFPTYHFAAVIDDHLMKITHVIRGDEYVSSAPKVVLMYKAFGWNIPYLIQTPNVLNPDGRKKLSKRGGSNTAHKFLRKGYIVEALWNFLVLLGWSPKGSLAKRDEIYSCDELVELFDVRRIQKSGARFLYDKLDHFNGYYIRSMDLDCLMNRIIEWAESYVLKDFVADSFVELESWEKDMRATVQMYLPLWKKDKEYFLSILALTRERIRYFSQIPEITSFFYDESFSYKKDEFDILDYKSKSSVLDGIWRKLKPEVEHSWSQDTWESTIRGFADSVQWKHGDMFMLLRLAVTGKQVSPPLFETMRLMGIKLCDDRVRQVVTLLDSSHDE